MTDVKSSHSLAAGTRHSVTRHPVTRCHVSAPAIGRLVIRVALAVVALGGPAAQAIAESAIPLLGGFDQKRIDQVYPLQGESAAGEISKLIFRLRSIDPKFLEDKLPAGDSQYVASVGDAVEADGQVQKVAELKVPVDLVEFLEFSSVQVIDLTVDDRTVRLISTGTPAEVKVGDRLSAVGILVEPAGDGPASPAVVAAPRVGWFPQSLVSDGWRLLSDQGVDVSSLAEVAGRNRQPLASEDGDAFYSVLSAASRIASLETAPPTARQVRPVELLQHPERYGGDWIRMNLETVQVTRVAVTEAARQTELGSDHYYQIDAVGRLGNVVVQIARPEGEEGPPVRFENRYPVSLVSRELPPFLRDQIRLREGGDAMVSEIRVPIQVDGFFFRLWSYSSEFMQQRGGGDQFGPLVIAAAIDDRSERDADPAGVGVIGWIAALVILSALLGFWLWSRANDKRDRRVKERRRQSEAEQLQLPDESAF